MANLSIQEIPIGSQWVSTIGRDDTPDKNDFEILIISDENITGLTESDITLSAVDRDNRAISSASLVSLEGANSVYRAVIRPPVTATGIVTVTIAANAVAEGNPQTSKDIRVSTSFPDTDAEVPTLLFNHGLTYRFIQALGVIRVMGRGLGIACTPNRIIITSSGYVVPRRTAGRSYIDFFTYDGVHQSAETITRNHINQRQFLLIDYINGDLLLAIHPFSQSYRYSRFNLKTQEYTSVGQGANLHTRLGYTRLRSDDIITQPFDLDENATTHTVDVGPSTTPSAHQNDLIYTLRQLIEITDQDEFRVLQDLNIARTVEGNNIRDIAIYQDTMYLSSENSIYTIDIRKYRPLRRNTKSTIYPIFAEAGSTIDLTQFSPDAERIVFDVGYDKPPFLTINSSNELVLGSGAQTCVVKLKAINRIDATETGSFGFYLIVRQAAAPVWRNVSELTMRAGSSYDLFGLVPDAESIAFRSGRSRLAGSSLSNGIFRVGTEGGVAEFTARKGGRSAHIAIRIDVVSGVETASKATGYRVEIAGIDVTADVLEFPSVSETLDPVVINEYRVNEATITLRNEKGKYNADIAGNFWETHGLNAGGFQNGVKIYTKHDRRGDLAPTENLLFTGLINESFEPIQGATFKLNCSDISSRLRKALAQDFGTLEKWDALRKQSDEDSYAGIYVPERSLVPMQIGTGKARSNRTDLDISRLELPSEGPAAENAGYMTPTEFRTAGGFLPENPLLGFKAEHLSEDVRFLIHQLAVNKEVYNTEIDIPGVEVEDPFLLNRGSVAFSVEPTRTTRLPVDWVHDSTNNRILVLLSNPEGHVADILVQYDINRDSYRVLHTFDKGVAVHRIERRNATNAYILTSGKITQDRSARQLPRPSDSTGYVYDSLAEGSEIKIYNYNTSTGALTEHVAEDDSFPPQLGIHYWIGFENSVYIDAFEGIVPSYRGAFKWQSGNLYYRYAKDGEFGVTRVDASGTTTQMIGETALGYQNHLNFAFGITSTGTIYFVYATGDADSSTLTIKRRTSSGTITTILSETRHIGYFNELGDDFGAFLGVHEALFHDNHLYILAPIQKADLGENATATDARPTLSTEIADTGMTGERSVTRVLLSPTSTRLAPGDAIPIRITFSGSVTGATQNDLTVRGGTIQSFSSVSNRIDVTIRPDNPRYHKNIVIDLARNAVTQRNEATRILVDFGTQRSRQKTAGMVLYRVATNAATPSLTVLEKWDFVHQAGCGLTVHNGAVHFTEQPPASQKFKPINPDLNGYWTDEAETETMGYNVLPESLGALKRINASGEVEHLGNVWHTDRPYNVFSTRMLSIDGDLHLSAGYGNLDELLRFNSLPSQADNMVHIVYGKTLHYVLPKFSPSGSVYAALASLAKSINATLSFEKNIIMITDRRPYRALTDGATGTGTGNLRFSDVNKAFPSSGYLLIGKEILRYTGITGGAFTGVQRGVLGSEIENHADDSKVLYLDNLIQSEKLGSPYKAITLSSDTNRIFNVIRDSGGVAEVRDEDSIALYGERPYTLDLGLTRHEKAWIEEIFASYLRELATLQQIVNIQVIPDFSLRLGQIVPFFYKGDLIRAMRIVSVRYEKNSTHLKGRTVA